MENESYENVIGNKLKRIRESYNIKKASMAKSFGVTIKEYEEYESGEKFPKDFPKEIIIMMFLDH
ncbi:MAG: hypothetical protein LBK26_01830 [Rickettsiales bacterium]|jgi:transcriptional regulator with XRE-family HTH domain|nr:hypothetical protein [Rickettsiales bacterium]